MWEKPINCSIETELNVQMVEGFEKTAGEYTEISNFDIIDDVEWKINCINHEQQSYNFRKSKKVTWSKCWALLVQISSRRKPIFWDDIRITKSRSLIDWATKTILWKI